MPEPSATIPLSHLASAIEKAVEVVKQNRPIYALEADQSLSPLRGQR